MYCGDVAADVGGEHAGLDFEHPAIAHLVAEDRVRHDGCLSLFVGLEESFAALFGEVAGFAPDQEILRRQAAGVDERQHDRIGNDGAELFHQIEGERRFAVPAHVEEAAIRVEADGAQARKNNLSGAGRSRRREGR